MGWVGHAAGIGYMKNTYNIFVLNPEWMIPVARPRRRQDKNRWMCRKQFVGVWTGLTPGNKSVCLTWSVKRLHWGV